MSASPRPPCASRAAFIARHGAVAVLDAVEEALSLIAMAIAQAAASAPQDEDAFYGMPGLTPRVARNAACDAGHAWLSDASHRRFEFDPFAFEPDDRRQLLFGIRALAAARLATNVVFGRGFVAYTLTDRGVEAVRSHCWPEAMAAHRAALAAAATLASGHRRQAPRVRA